MDGTKHATETLNSERNVVGRCFVGVEVCAKVWMDPTKTRILPIVAAKFGENPNHLNRWKLWLPSKVKEMDVSGETSFQGKGLGFLSNDHRLRVSRS